MPLRNRYFIMRHGESEANRAGLIVSDPRVGVGAYGLTDEGSKQVKASLEKHASVPVTVIYTSDFARARETAELAGEFFKVDTFVVTDLLRERFFGDYDGREDRYYHSVWEIDSRSPREYPAHIESPVRVKDRILRLIREIEHRRDGDVVLLVSHGDTLQILMAVLAGIPAPHHRSLPHLEKAEIREIVPAESFTAQEVL
ncbi:MAG: histidine phosphatase family protein [Spirochaetae bacterium HGW-Spirochaetae-1]|nr:MAG: histidine phosphatase family protein [Spirochaetae bacterium HGW-Spirochaetae-1]